MRIVMPLFEFECSGAARFAFSSCGVAVEPFTKDEILRLPGFSEQDIHFMEAESWALIYDGPDISEYKVLVNLLLMSFRLFCGHNPPFIKYRLCKADTQLSRRINQPMTYNFSAPRCRNSYERADLEQIDAGFQHLRRMDATSTRTHNALYFLYRAFHAGKWIDAFVLMMSSLESLFSKDAPGGATEAIAIRVSSLLGSRVRCTKADVEGLYALRSAMTHGRLVASDNTGKNLNDLEHLEFITGCCFKELVNRNAYVHYATKSERDRFMGTLNTSP